MPLMYAVEAASRKIVAGGGGGGSGTPIASADFVNEIYSYNGSTITLADITTDTGNRSASGLVIFPSSNIVNDFLSLLNTLNWTAVVQFVPNSLVFSGGNGVEFIEGTRAGFNDYCAIYTTNGLPEFYDQNDAASGRDLTDSNSAIVDVVNKIACTRTNSELAFSINGHAAVSQLSALGSVITDTFVFCDGSTTSMGFLQKVDIYSPQSNSALPTLSA